MLVRFRPVTTLSRLSLVSVSHRIFGSTSSSSQPENDDLARDGSDNVPAYLPWNSRPWRVTYQHSAAEIDNLDHNMCSILSEDSSVMYKFLSNTLGEGKDVNDYVEDPVQNLQEQQRKRQLMEAAKMSGASKQYGAATGATSKKSGKATSGHRRKSPATYIQIV